MSDPDDPPLASQPEAAPDAIAESKIKAMQATVQSLASRVEKASALAEELVRIGRSESEAPVPQNLLTEEARRNLLQDFGSRVIVIESSVQTVRESLDRLTTSVQNLSSHVREQAKADQPQQGAGDDPQAEPLAAKFEPAWQRLKDGAKARIGKIRESLGKLRGFVTRSRQSAADPLPEPDRKEKLMADKETGISRVVLGFAGFESLLYSLFIALIMSGSWSRPVIEGLPSDIITTTIISTIWIAGFSFVHLWTQRLLTGMRPMEGISKLEHWFDIVTSVLPGLVALMFFAYWRLVHDNTASWWIWMLDLDLLIILGAIAEDIGPTFRVIKNRQIS